MKKQYQFFFGGCDSCRIPKCITLNFFSRLGQETEFGKFYKNASFSKTVGLWRCLTLITYLTNEHWSLKQ